MSPETTNVAQESLPAQGVEQTESPAANEQLEQASENPTPQQGDTQVQPQTHGDEQAVPYSRFKDVIDERNWYKQQIEALVQKQTQPIQQQVQQETVLGNTPEEREFWQMQRKIAREEAEKVAQAKEQLFQSQLESVRAQQAAQMEQEFRSKHPDVKRGSMEEVEIAQKIQMGYLPDDAYWAVMGARGLINAQSQAVKKVQQNIIQKKQANVENSSGVSSQIKSQPPKSVDEMFAENWLKMERGEL